MSKYRAIPCEIKGRRFASLAEGRRYQELLLLGAAGELYNLELQPRFPLVVHGQHTWKRTTVAHYVADFAYNAAVSGMLVVEDVKGMATPVYKLKKKMVEAQYGIEIREIR